MISKKILILISLLFIGTGCESPITKRDKEITELKAKIFEIETKSNFEKKQKCATYLEKMKNEYEYAYKGSFSTINEIFYSPKQDSCLILKYTWIEGNKVAKDSQIFQIYDVLTKEYIDSIDSRTSDENLPINIKVFEMTKKYK